MKMEQTSSIRYDKQILSAMKTIHGSTIKYDLKMSTNSKQIGLHESKILWNEHRLEGTQLMIKKLWYFIIREENSGHHLQVPKTQKANEYLYHLRNLFDQ